MPINQFNSLSDGLAPDQRSRAHFIADIDLEDGPHWVPYADGVWIQPCHFNTTGGFSVVLKGLPGAALGTHYHIGTVLELARKYYREAGLDVRKLDVLAR